jgi:hypothetical protein
MNIRPIFILSAVLACSSVAFSLLGHLDSKASSIWMMVLAAIDFVTILYFFTGKRYAEIMSSSLMIQSVSGIIIVLFWLVGVLIG